MLRARPALLVENILIKGSAHLFSLLRTILISIFDELWANQLVSQLVLDSLSAGSDKVDKDKGKERQESSQTAVLDKPLRYI